MWIFKRLARVNYKDRMTNEEVLSRLGVKRGLLSQIRTRKLSYFGHIARHVSLQKTVLTGRIDGRRGKGRPRRHWNDDINEWTGNQLYTNIKLAQDRVTWRSVASRSQNGPQQPEWQGQQQQQQQQQQRSTTKIFNCIHCLTQLGDVRLDLSSQLPIFFFSKVSASYLN